MATKTICDGCGRDIPKWQPGSSGAVKIEGDGLRRSAQLELGNNVVQWDLCVACFVRAAGALAEVLPSSPRSEWNHVLGLGPRPKE